jgi:(p)ppGpp synthase/HD superfamily hydrolase
MDAAKETYERFMDRCEIFFPHAKCVEISIVYALTKHYHRFDVRKDELDEQGNPLPYYIHPRRVALILLDELAIPDPDLVVCGLLHDTVEDTRLMPEAITLVCGAENSKRVMLMSKKPKQGFHQRLLDHADWKTLIVKMVDRLDNVRSLLNSSPEFIAKQVKETHELYYPLMTVVMERTPVEYQSKVRKLQALLVEATEAAARKIA